MDINKTYWYIKNQEPPCFLITHKNYKSDHFLGQKASFNTFHGIVIIQSTVSDDKDKHYYPIGSALLVQTGEFSLKTTAPIIQLPTARDTGCHLCKENAFKSSSFTYL